MTAIKRFVQTAPSGIDWKPIESCPKIQGTVYLITDGIVFGHAVFDRPATRGSNAEPWWDTAAGTPYSNVRSDYDRWCDCSGVLWTEPTHWSDAIEPPRNSLKK